MKSNDILRLEVLRPFGKRISITSSYTLLDANMIFADATGGAITVNMPSAANNEMVYTVIKTDASGNAVTVAGYGSETINGATTKVLSSQYSAATIVSNGSAWFVA